MPVPIAIAGVIGSGDRMEDAGVILMPVPIAIAGVVGSGDRMMDVGPIVLLSRRSEVGVRDRETIVSVVGRAVGGARVVCAVENVVVRVAGAEEDVGPIVLFGRRVEVGVGVVGAEEDVRPIVLFGRIVDTHDV